MKQHFQGWDAVAQALVALVAASAGRDGQLNEGQRACLRGMAARLRKRCDKAGGMVIADEVGMGKTRIAVNLAKSVIAAGGRVAILVPPGLGVQWRAELRDGGVDAPPLLRSLWQYLCAWVPENDSPMPWFEQDVVLLSHAFAPWRAGKSLDSRRRTLFPAIYAWARQARQPALRLYRHQTLTDPAVQAAARSIVATVRSLEPSSPAARVLDELVNGLRWRDVLDGSRYGRWEDLRPSLERVVGLGLGVFDLVIIDEAHKSRGDESGLSRLLEGVVLAGDSTRRLAMSATPVELDVRQWHQTLQRIGVDAAALSGEDSDIFDRYAEACHRVRQSPGSAKARAAYRAAASVFEKTLSPFLLRRDKREVDAVKAFAAATRMPYHTYREEHEVSVDTLELDPAWKRAVCAAEALSIVARGHDDQLLKRLRLTLGNGHGIAALIDQVQRDADKDCLQMEEDACFAGKSTATADPVPGQPDKRMQRSAWWRDVISAAFAGDGDPLYFHPALLAAVKAIEAVTDDGEKVLVFGRFTRPLQALVHLLNARQLLRTLDASGSWPQAKVHADEWTALQAAHLQLGREGMLDRAALDAALASQYEKLENRRATYRGGLLDAIDTGLPHSGRARQVFDTLRQATRRTTGETDNPLVLLARAMQDLTADETRRDARTGTVFAELLDAACGRGDEEGDEDAEGSLDPDEAAALWETLQERLREEFNRPQGSFARLMYGGTPPQTRQLLQLAFNRAGTHPRVLVAQSMVGREGLNLHRACKTVVLLHPEWNPGVVEQQIGRVDRVGSLWERQMEERLGRGAENAAWPRILVRPVVFRGTYDERNWDVLRERWDELRAQLHGVVLSPRLAAAYGIDPVLVDEINGAAPRFSPKRRRGRTTSHHLESLADVTGH